jgi:hypothetical protein
VGGSLFVMNLQTPFMNCLAEDGQEGNSESNQESRVEMIY